MRTFNLKPKTTREPSRIITERIRMPMANQNSGRNRSSGIIAKLLCIIAALLVCCCIAGLALRLTARSGNLKTGAAAQAAAQNTESAGYGDVSGAQSAEEGKADGTEAAAGGSDAVTAEEKAAESEAPKTEEKTESEAPKAGEKAESVAPKTEEKAESEAPKAEEKAESEAPKAEEKAESEAPKAESTASAASHTENAVPELVLAETPSNSAELLASKTEDSFWEGCPERQIRLLTPNQYSRPQIPLTQVNAIVIHYVANPGTTAAGNWDYFEGLKTGKGASAGAHFIIGLDGEIIQCTPISELVYGTSRRNQDTLSIECCHPDADGKFSDATYASLIDLSAWLCKALHVSPDNVIRHHDVWGKPCPKYYVEHPEAWEQMKSDIRERYGELTAE